MQCHKRSLKLNEDHVKRIRAYRDEFWNESIVVFKNPQFDFTAAPRIVFAGEAGVDAGGLGREYGILLRNAIFSAKANLFEGPEDIGKCHYIRLMALTPGCFNLLVKWYHI